MPVPIVQRVLYEGFGSIPYTASFLKLIPIAALLYFIRAYFQGANNKSERKMHSKVVMMTVRDPNLRRLSERLLNFDREAHPALEEKSHASWLREALRSSSLHRHRWTTPSLSTTSRIFGLSRITS